MQEGRRYLFRFLLRRRATLSPEVALLFAFRTDNVLAVGTCDVPAADAVRILRNWIVTINVHLLQQVSDRLRFGSMWLLDLFVRR